LIYFTGWFRIETINNEENIRITMEFRTGAEYLGLFHWL